MNAIRCICCEATFEKGAVRCPVCRVLVVPDDDYDETEEHIYTPQKPLVM